VAKVTPTGQRNSVVISQYNAKQRKTNQRNATRRDETNIRRATTQYKATKRNIQYKNVQFIKAVQSKLVGISNGAYLKFFSTKQIVNVLPQFRRKFVAWSTEGRRYKDRQQKKQSIHFELFFSRLTSTQIVFVYIKVTSE